MTRSASLVIQRIALNAAGKALQKSSVKAEDVVTTVEHRMSNGVFGNHCVRITRGFDVVVIVIQPKR